MDHRDSPRIQGSTHRDRGSPTSICGGAAAHRRWGDAGRTGSDAGRRQAGRRPRSSGITTGRQRVSARHGRISAYRSPGEAVSAAWTTHSCRDRRALLTSDAGAARYLPGSRLSERPWPGPACRRPRFALVELRPIIPFLRQAAPGRSGISRPVADHHRRSKWARRPQLLTASLVGRPRTQDPPNYLADVTVNRSPRSGGRRRFYPRDKLPQIQTSPRRRRPEPSRGSILGPEWAFRGGCEIRPRSALAGHDVPRRAPVSASVPGCDPPRCWRSPLTSPPADTAAAVHGGAGAAPPAMSHCMAWKIRGVLAFRVRRSGCQSSVCRCCCEAKDGRFIADADCSIPSIPSIHPFPFCPSILHSSIPSGLHSIPSILINLISSSQTTRWLSLAGTTSQPR